MRYKFAWKRIGDNLYQDQASGLIYVRKSKKGFKSLNRSTGTKDRIKAEQVRDRMIAEWLSPKTDPVPTAEPANAKERRNLILDPGVRHLYKDQRSGLYYIRLIKSLQTKDRNEAVKLMAQITRALEV
jgi:hypothetical protein